MNPTPQRGLLNVVRIGGTGDRPDLAVAFNYALPCCLTSFAQNGQMVTFMDDMEPIIIAVWMVIIYQRPNHPLRPGFKPVVEDAVYGMRCHGIRHVVFTG